MIWDRLTQVQTAWLWLVVALALHVIDEASTGFLDVYNPTVRALRERLGWFPMPEFSFDVWVTGLAVLVLGLALLTPLIDRGSGAVRAVTIVFAGLMVLNGAAHITGTIVGRTVATVPFEPNAWLLVIAASDGWRGALRCARTTSRRSHGVTGCPLDARVSDDQRRGDPQHAVRRQRHRTPQAPHEHFVSDPNCSTSSSAFVKDLTSNRPPGGSVR